jgi:hypothetical protein
MVLTRLVVRSRRKWTGEVRSIHWSKFLLVLFPLFLWCTIEALG